MCADLCSRRAALGLLSSGFCLVALHDLLAQEGPRVPRHPAKATNVILCYMSGGVSHVDTFDPKPALEKLAGKPMPVTVLRTQFNQNGSVTPSHWAYRNRGKSGLPVSELFPEIGSCADDLCVLRSGDAAVPHGGVGVYGSGFLPAQHQASMLSVDRPEPLPNVKPREEAGAQRRRLDLIGALDRGFAGAPGSDPSLEAAIANYEMAWRMQSAVPELCDLRNEDPSMTKLYGLDDPEPKTAAYARQCLTARRLVERGVRFVELSCLTYNIGAGNAPNPWDQHSDLKKGHGAQGHQIDRPIAGLLKDLKARGLLETTLVIWMGEFGRTPFSQGSNGRDHNPHGFSIWMAGGGVKGGFAYGATDEFGYHAMENPLTVYDVWATVLHLLGIDHQELTFRFGGRDLRLTDVHGRVIRDLLA